MPRDLRQLLHETASTPARPVDGAAIVRRARRARAARRVAASTLGVLVVAAGAVMLIRGPGQDEVLLEPVPRQVDTPVLIVPPGPDPAARPTPPGPTLEPQPEAAAPPTPEPDLPERPETEEPTMPAPPEPEPEPEPDPAPEPAPDVVTEADEGATFVLQPGQSTALRLSNDWLWDAPEVSGAAVDLVQVDYFADPRFVEWQVEAVAAGTAEVTVTGTPNCGEETDCPPLRVTLRFDVSG